MRGTIPAALLVLVAHLANGAVIPNLTTEEIEIKARCYRDLYFFAHEILGYNLLDTGIHRDLCSFLADNAASDLLILEPRDHFKTTCLIAFVMQAIINNPDVKILYSHKTLNRSRDILREISGHFEKNQTFRHFFGDWRGEPWGQYAITVSKRTRNMKEPTVSVGAVDHGVVSGHFNIIINDDLAGLEDMYSEAARDSTERYYKSLRYIRDGGASREINTGTRWAHNDVYEYIMKKRPDVIVRIKRARMDDGKPYFPARYTNERLLELEKEDPVLYASQMMNEPSHRLGQLYPQKDLQFFAFSDVFRNIYNVAYVDPAFGKQIRGEPCYFCLIIGGLVGDKVHILEWICNREKPEFNELLIAEKVQKYHVKKLGIESNAGQSEFIRNVRRTFSDHEISLGIEEINHTTNKDRRIQGMHGTVVEKVHFRDDWEKAYPEAMRQLMLYPQARFCDGPDALAGLIEIACKPKAGSFKELVQKPARPFSVDMAGIAGGKW